MGEMTWCLGKREKSKTGKKKKARKEKREKKRDGRKEGGREGGKERGRERKKTRYFGKKQNKTNRKEKAILIKCGKTLTTVGY